MLARNNNVDFSDRQIHTRSSMKIDANGAPTAESPTADQIENEGAVAPEGSDANPAASSPADEKDAKPVDLLSVVKNAVVEKDDDDDAEPSAAAGVGEAQPGEAEGKAPEGPTDAAAEADADAKLPFHNHPRWKQVIEERDGYRKDADRIRRIDSFCDKHGLEPSEVSEGFDIMAKLKSGDPEQLGEVREWFATRLTALNTMLGVELPDDLRERVENGLVDEETAQELARTRAADKLRTARAEADQTAEAQTREQRQREANATAMATAVDDWEKRQKAADPDYARKAELVLTTCRAIVHETGKPPRSAEEALALSEEALKRVNKTFKGLVPTPKPIRRDPAGSSAVTVHEPKSLREAIAAAASRG